MQFYSFQSFHIKEISQLVERKVSTNTHTTIHPLSSTLEFEKRNRMTIILLYQYNKRIFEKYVDYYKYKLEQVQVYH